MPNTTSPAQRLSAHFTLVEATTSDTAARAGIDNTLVNPELLLTLTRTATKLEKVRVLVQQALHIHSWYRCLKLNKLIGSSDNSQHVKGEAVDFSCPLYGSPLEICKLILANKELIRFDQLILEHTWVHISFCAPNVQPRGQVLSLLKGGKYASGLTNLDGTPYV